MENEVRRVINGKSYETSTAVLVMMVAVRNYGFDELNNEWTGLYRTQRGQWSLAGRGGADTRWRKRNRNDDGYVGGSGVLLTANKTAQELLEEHNGDVERYFDIEEG